MHFKIINDFYEIKQEGIIYLENDNWDDWFQFETVFKVLYFNDGKVDRIGLVKIAKKNQEERRAKLPEEFNALGDAFFSLGCGEEYYESLKQYSFREEYLTSMNDMAYNLEIFNRVKDYDVTKISLMRDVTSSEVKGQIHRMANGGARLTNYDFTYILPCKTPINNKNVRLNFNVEIEKMPPTNIHVLIGKNGVGKTTILKNMLMVLEKSKKYGNLGVFEMDWENDFSNIVFVSFSAFDMSIDESDFEEKSVIPYTFVGLTRKKSIKSNSQLANDFCESLYAVIKSSKKKLWNQTIDILESDNTFPELGVKNWIEVKKDRRIEKEIKEYIEKRVDEKDYQFKIRIEKEYYKREIKPKFLKLSSGHKIILLTITKLIELVEEKTLVLLDEPEEHLHPPLVSAFIRALSNLLIYKNGVGIIATHSPVIVQEIPKKCIWILRRTGNTVIAERPQFETFGENLGELTSEIFGYEVTNSGFHKILQKVANEKKTYKQALRYFNNELGKEAKSILKAYMYEKEYLEDE